MLRTKGILEEIEPEIDGLRISVMSRHTENDEKTPDNRLIGRYDIHLSDLGPPAKLVSAWYRGLLSWKEFERGYGEYLNNPNIRKIVKNLANYASSRDVTILCIEDKPDKCHRRLLAAACQQEKRDLFLSIS